MTRCILTHKLKYSMAKIYSKKNLVTTQMKPKKEVISFLLNYSKALHMIKVADNSFEIIAN